jgi:uncharacterized coiled-coil DUF342 family protein
MSADAAVQLVKNDLENVCITTFSAACASIAKLLCDSGASSKDAVLVMRELGALAIDQDCILSSDMSTGEKDRRYAQVVAQIKKCLPSARRLLNKLASESIHEWSEKGSLNKNHAFIPANIGSNIPVKGFCKLYEITTRKQEEADLLKGQVGELQEKVKNLTAAADSEKKRADGLQEKGNALAATADSEKGRADGLHEKVKTLTAAADSEKGRADGLHEKVKTLTAAADSEKGRAESEKKRAESEKKRAESEKERADSEKKRADGLQEKVNVLTAAADSEKGRAESEKGRADGLQEKVNALTAAADSEKGRADSEKKRADGLQEKVNVLTAAADSEKGRADGLQEKVNALTATADSEKKRAKSEKKRADGLQEAITTSTATDENDKRRVDSEKKEMQMDAGGLINARANGGSSSGAADVHSNGLEKWVRMLREIEKQITDMSDRLSEHEHHHRHHQPEAVPDVFGQVMWGGDQCIPITGDSALEDVERQAVQKENVHLRQQCTNAVAQLSALMRAVVQLRGGMMQAATPQVVLSPPPQDDASAEVACSSSSGIMQGARAPGNAQQPIVQQPGCISASDVQEGPTAPNTQLKADIKNLLNELKSKNAKSFDDCNGQMGLVAEMIEILYRKNNHVYRKQLETDNNVQLISGTVGNHAKEGDMQSLRTDIAKAQADITGLRMLLASGEKRGFLDCNGSSEEVNGTKKPRKNVSKMFAVLGQYSFAGKSDVCACVFQGGK